MSHPQIHETHPLPSKICEVFAVRRILSKVAHRSVFVADHLPSGGEFVIKKLTLDDDLALLRRALREVTFLRYFNHENIISIQAIKTSREYDSLTNIYLFQELMATDMRDTIATNQLSEDACQFLTRQILCAVETMHSAGILHRDLKPSNLLLDKDYNLKVGDLSLARSAIKVPDKLERIGTLPYRAPELLLSYDSHTKAVDVWSVGCILAEMLSGEQIFPGTAHIPQLNGIFSVLGTPAVQDTLWISSDPIRGHIRGLPPQRKVPWKELFPRASDGVLDLLERLLTFNPTKRINAKEALEHPFLRSRQRSTEKSSATPVPNELFHFDAETDDLTGEQLKREIIW
jgi:mitogen-activated protein kinase 1/3